MGMGGQTETAKLPVLENDQEMGHGRGGILDGRQEKQENC